MKNPLIQQSVAVLILMSLIAATQPQISYPFGSEAGDIFNPTIDDGSSSVINLLAPFPFFGNTYYQIFVNNNGFLTFDQPSSVFVPYNFQASQTDGRDIIAPFWTDLDNRRNGTISYQQYINGSVLIQATQDINHYFPGYTFTASWVFVATWDKVEYFSFSGTQTSFQVVLISDGNLSFVLMNYGDIAPTAHTVEAGYTSMNSTHYNVTLWSTNTGNLSTLTFTSNVNVIGRWAFMVNLSKWLVLKKDYIAALQLKVTADHEITINNTQQITSLIQDILIKNGLPTTLKLHVTSIKNTGP